MDNAKAELINSSDALLDKAVINHFSVVDIENIADLQRGGIVTTRENATNYLTTKYGEIYNSINIKEADLFESFFYSINQRGNGYGELVVTISNRDFHNLNCFTAEEYRKRLNEIAAFLHKEYGIIVDFSKAAFKSLEINKTIYLLHPYHEYYRVLDLIIHNLPHSLRLRDGKEDYNEIPSRDSLLDKKRTETYYKSSGKRGLTIKIYDKRKQLEDKYHEVLKGNYLRFEITLNSGGKIKKCLGTREVSKLTDKQINRYFSDFIEKNVIKPYKQFLNMRNDALLKMLTHKYMPSNRSWILETLLQIKEEEMGSRIPFLLDINELIPLLNDLPFANRQIKYNAKNSFFNTCKKNCAIFIQNDDQKYLELNNKLISHA